MREDKGNIIYEFLKRLNNSDMLSISELGNINFNSDFDNEIIDYLVENDLIKSVGGQYKSGNNVYIRPKGKDILEYGSWKEYIYSISNKQNEQIKIDIERQYIKDKIDKLTLDSLEHDKTVRTQNDRIRNLEEKLKRVNVIKEYWWLIGLGVAIGQGLVELYKYLSLLM